MTPIAKSWLRRLGMAAVAACSLAAVTLPTAPAQARVDVGIGIPFGGYYAPYYGYGYGYGYRPYYYGYGYPAGGVFLNFGGGHHHHHWR